MKTQNTDRIEAIEAANRIMRDLRYVCVAVNPTGWDMLRKASNHLNDELKAMISE